MNRSGLLGVAFRAVRAVAFAALFLWAVANAWAAPADVAGADLAEFKAKVEPVLAKLCYNCHGQKQQKGDVRLDVLNPDLAKGTHAETWHDALNRLNLGEMPPPEATQPTAEQRAILVRWISTALQQADQAKRYAGGRVVMRRLTRYEYQNTMRDLLGVELDFSKNVPPDAPSPDGFLNNAATLEMSPTQMEVYLGAARQGLREAIVTGDQPAVHQLSADRTAVGRLPNRKIAGHASVNPEFLMDLKTFPRRGEFRIRIRAGAVIPVGHDYPRLQLWLGCVPGIVHVPRKLVGEVEVTAPIDQPQTFTFGGRIEDFPQPGDVPFGNVDFDGMIALVDFLDADGRELRYADRAYASPPNKKGKNSKQEPRSAKSKSSPAADDSASLDKPRLDIVIHSVEFEAPVLQSWPPPSHTRILFPAEDQADEPGYVRQVLRRFMTRAFRRPVAEDEVQRTAKLFEIVHPLSPSREEAIRETLASVLVSPHFLYMVETRDETAQGQPVNDFELANRLSYFLWSSMPDDTLLELAGQGKLHEGSILEEQVRRMLNDGRAANFASQLADQWFDLHALDRVAVNPEFHPDFDNQLKEYMRTETRSYLAEILRSDLSCLDLLDSSWTMLNRPLAEHYRVAGPRSLQFERVELADQHIRGGLLGQGAFLLSNSNGVSSHPIKRAVWILDRLLDSPPAPPPPDVPELDAESPDLAGLSLKEQLAVHRQKQACANCHRGIDPWGLPLEHFNAVGIWRSEERSESRGAQGGKRLEEAVVDASSILPDGTKIGGFAELKQYLLQQRREQFARAVVKRLAAYALGRSLDAGDRQTVQTLTEQFVQGDFRLRSLIIALAESDSFQTK